jgi:putative endonuclease
LIWPVKHQPVCSPVIAVYRLASLSRRLYVGVSGDLYARVWQHRSGRFPGFARKCRVTRLVWYETTDNIRAAVEREKQLKGWSRERKIRLIESINAGWIDLAQDWFRDTGR